MLKLPLRKLYFIVKLCFLFVLVLMTLSLFEYWRGGKRASRAELLDPEEEIYERQILEDEARIVPGLGEGGRPAYLTGEEKRLGEEAEKKYAVNTYLSDRIAYNRTLKDFRNPACERVTYDAELPSTSVIIIFHNEPYSVVIRTIWSVLNTARRDRPWHRQANYLERGTGRVMKLGYPGQPEDSEYVYLKEIILVDDNSTLPELRGKLARYIRTRLPADMVRVLRLPDRIGLTRARLAGARYANGEVLVFLDAHCEGMTDWLRPLLQRIKASPTTVAMPIIDVVEHKDFYYSVQDPAVFQVGGFTFVGHFTWIDVPEREKKRRGSDIAPTWSPTMAGGLFAIRRAYYWELGAYDEQMAGWGGENLEMSFRIWQCGGTLETIPCSRVGHVFRSFHPYGLPANSDTHGINTARMAEVWMDDYAELFYLHRPDLRRNPIIGDVTHRKILREKLHCKSFQWFLDNIYKEKYVPVRDSKAFGRVKNIHLCLDTMQREGEATPLGFYPCHKKLTDTQYLSLSFSGQLRDEERCAEVQFMRRAQDSGDEDSASRLVVMVTCRENTAKMQWRYIASTSQLQHVDSGLCLDARRARAGDDARAWPCEPEPTPSQSWTFDYMGDNDHSGILPAELEQVLSKIRGQRRKSRSLLAVTEVTEAATEAAAGAEAGAGAEAEAGADGARRQGHTRRRYKKQKKKVHKNKFIVTVERRLPNSSMEHLEMDIHCKHQRLYPNNSFVRDLVSILNDRNIRVINNGRVFEKNRVVDIEKERSLRQIEDKVRTVAPTPETEADEALSESTEMFQTSAAPLRFATDRDDEVAPPPHITGTAKPKKRHHKKKHPGQKQKKPLSPSHEHSLLLSDREDIGYRVAIGSGGVNGTGASLSSRGAFVGRARETDTEPERERERDVMIDSRSTFGEGQRPPYRNALAHSYVSTLRPEDAELRLSEDLARDSRDRSRGRDERDEGLTRGGETNILREARMEERRMREEDRYAIDRAREKNRALRDPGRARSDAIARHAEVYEFKKVSGERPHRKSRGGKSRTQVHDARKRTQEDKNRERWPPHSDRETDHNTDGEIGRLTGRISDIGGFGGHTDRHPDESRKTDAQPRAPTSWDPWAPRPAPDARREAPGARPGAGARAGAVAAAVEKLVYHDVWDATHPPEAKDKRVSDLAREVMMEYEDLTEEPLLKFRVESEDASDESPREKSEKPLRVRLKSNMTFNLGDELLNWRRIQMAPAESESGSDSGEVDLLETT